MTKGKFNINLSKTINKVVKRPNTTREMKPLSKIEEHIYDVLEGNKKITPKEDYLNKPLKRSIYIFIKLGLLKLISLQRLQKLL
jgi:hypothetical protein